MKKYLLFSCNCEGIGGGKLYLKNKILYLRERGWDVELFPWRQFTDEKVIIPELRGFQLYKQFAYALAVPPHYLSARKRRKIVSAMADAVHGADTYFIESNSVTVAYWAELLAKELQCPHLCFIFTERYNSVMDYDFFEFKLQRHELAGINLKSLPALFKRKRELSESEKYVLKAPCAAAVADYCVPMLKQLKRADYTIGTIGRLEKKYVSTMLQGITDFCGKYRSKTINLILVGDTANETIRNNLESYIAAAPHNLEIIPLGFLSPLPEDLFKVVDLFIATSGSANVSARHGVPTISMDVEDGLPIGILGYTTVNSQYRAENEQDTDLIKWMESVLIDGTYKEKQFYLPPKKENTLLMDQHFAFMEQASPVKEYYDFSAARIHGGGLRKLFCRVFGYKAYYKFVTHFFH